MKMPQNPPNNKIILFIIAFFLSNPPLLFSDAESGALKKSPAYKTMEIEVLKRVSLPKGYHEGLSLDGSSLLVSNGEKGKVWVVDMVKESVTSTIEPIAGFTESMLKLSGNQYFVTDWDEKKLYRASLDGNRLSPEVWVSVKPAHPAGLVWTGDRLFMITWTRGMGTRFDLLELDKNMNLSGTISIQSIQEPAHLAWDGEYLWISSWYDQLVYKIDVKKWEILGAFRSPVSRTTGIAWDGKYLWLTGTHDDLFKLQVL